MKHTIALFAALWLGITTALSPISSSAIAQTAAAAKPAAAAKAPAPAQAADPLPSWNDGPAKRSIITFVEKVTKAGSPDFVPPAERIAVFDNDGTLWGEKPVPVQLYFMVDRIKALAPQHAEWSTAEPFASMLKGDVKAVMAGGEKALLELAMATHAGMTTAEFEKIVTDWILTARHPTTGLLFTEMAYQPMLELLAFLRASGFKNYIVSGGGIEFMRPWAERVYGIPPEQVIGSSIKTKFELRDGQPAIVRLPELNFNDDKGGKPVAINQHIGRRPIAAFGNSDGDLQMLQWTGAGSGSRFCLYVHHDDAAREFAYDRQDGLAKLDKGLDEAAAKGWTVVSMKNDWTQVYAAPASAPDITAIDILLQPDAAMLRYAAAENAKLLGVYPKGFSLDEAHAPHITMLQCFVNTADLPKLYKVVGTVLAAANVKTMELEAFKLYYIPAGNGLGVAGICARPTPELLKLQADIIAAVAPYNLRSGSIDALTARHDDPATDAGLVQYVSTFEQIAAGPKFNPHVSTGAAPTAYLDKLVAEPFKPFTFSPAGAAMYQLGPFGTAAKELKVWGLYR